MRRQHWFWALGSALVAVLAVAMALIPASAAVTTQSSWGATLTCTTDANGYCTVAHPAGVIPDDVVVTPALSAMVAVDQITSTNFRIRFARAVAANGTVTPITGARTFYVHVDWTPGVSSPSAISSPSAVPSASPPVGFPNATNTGVPAGTTLTDVNSDVTVSTANTVIDSEFIHGCVTVNAPGVVIKNSRISGPCFFAIGSFVGSYTGAPLTVQDSEVDCASTSGTAFSEFNIVALRVNVHGCENGFDINNTVTVRDSYIHDLFSTSESHTDGAQVNPSAHDVTFIHNYIDPLTDATSAIITPSESIGAATNVLVQNNLLGGGAYSLYCTTGGASANFRVIDNHFLRDFAFGPWTDCADETQVTGNVWDDTGAPVPLS
jgi:hypothetical protein